MTQKISAFCRYDLAVSSTGCRASPKIGTKTGRLRDGSLGEKGKCRFCERMIVWVGLKDGVAHGSPDGVRREGLGRRLEVGLQERDVAA
jgi:hypothetical protein